MYAVRSKSGRVVRRFATQREALAYVRRIRTARSPLFDAETLSDWRQEGGQEAASAMDVNEIRNALGSTPSAKEIEAWLLAGKKKPYLKLPAGANAAQRVEIVRAWARGWAEYTAWALANPKAYEKVMEEGE